MQALNHSSNEPDEPVRPLVIERPDLQNSTQRWGYRSVTLAFWILWLYLFVPILSFLAWVLGLSVIYQVLLQGLDFAQFWIVLRGYALGVAILSSIYLLWALYNLIRFRGRERRVHAPLVADDLLAATHNIDLKEMSELKQAGKIIIANEMLDRMFKEHR